MRSIILYVSALFAATAVSAWVIATPVATAAPECTNVGPNTTQCQTNGSSQIVTSPSVTANEYWGWPWGGIVISLGGLGW